MTETWLHPGILDSELGFYNYSIYRKDRYDIADAPVGGGVLIAVKDTLKSKVIAMEGDAEQLFVEVTNLSKNLVVGSFYAPYVNPGTYAMHFEVIELLMDKFRDYEFMIMGDYNLRETLWTNHGGLSEGLLANCFCSDTLVQECSIAVMNMFSYFGMSQYFPVHHSKGYTLDLAFSTITEGNVKQLVSSDFLVPCDPHHDQVFLEIGCMKSDYIKCVKNKLDFRNADYVAINSELLSTNWESLFIENCVDKCTDIFYSVIREIIVDFVPLKRVSLGTYPVWYSQALITNIVNKKKYHKEWLQFRIYSDYIEFKKLRSMCIRQSKIDRQQYILRVEERSTKNIKYFWNYINNLTCSKGVPEEMFLRGSKSMGGRETCNLFAGNFEFAYLQSGSSFHHQLHLDCGLDFTITLEEITSTIKNIKDTNNIGPDGLSAYFVKNCIESIVKPLHLLYGKSLDSGKMPDIWKKTFVTPVFKSGNRNDVLNYRPIAIIGIISKVLDSIVANHLSEICLLFIIRNQHGFVKGRSTVTNLVFYNSFIAGAFSDADRVGGVKQVDSIYLDFAKAFDSVNHNLLLYKLSKFGLSGGTLRWIFSYLSNREQVVRIKGHFSEPYVASSGVPQGSHLGPLLFILFINDICKELKFAEVLIFADDIKLFNRVKTVSDQACLQEDLDRIVKWSCQNNLRLNCAKCKSMSFVRGKKYKLVFGYQISGQILESVDNIEDLGVIYQSNFEFNVHLEATVSRGYRMLGFIKRSTKEFNSHNAIVHLYKTIVRPIILYASIIWSPSKVTHVKILESVQHKFLRYIAFRMGRGMNYDDHDYTDIAQSVKLESLKSLHVFHDLYFVKKVKLNLISSPDVVDIFGDRSVPYNLRLVRQLNEETSDSNYIYFSTVYRLRRKWNRVVIPSHLSGVYSLRNFKKGLKILVNRFL